MGNAEARFWLGIYMSASAELIFYYIFKTVRCKFDSVEQIEQNQSQGKSNVSQEQFAHVFAFPRRDLISK